MRSLRKAQTATEYMIILAVIIIIALIVVGVMGGIPGLGGGSRKRAFASYWQSADVGIVAYSVDSNRATLKIRNNLRDAIDVTSIQLDTTSVFSGTQNLAPGKTTTIYSTSVRCRSGEPYTYDVNITYTDDETGASYEFTGMGNKLEGRCAAGDQTAPVVTLTSPIAGSQNKSLGNITYTYQVSDATSNITSCSLYIDATQNSTDTSITKDIAQTFSINMTSHDDGVVQWYVSCIEDSQNQNTGTSSTGSYNLTS